VLVYIILGYGPCTDCALSIYCSFAGWLCLYGLRVVWLCFLASGTLEPVSTSEVGESCCCCCLAVVAALQLLLDAWLFKLALLISACIDPPRIYVKWEDICLIWGLFDMAV
jgi:hypothetical protein